MSRQWHISLKQRSRNVSYSALEAEIQSHKSAHTSVTVILFDEVYVTLRAGMS